jgi:hypothetical protein
MSIETAVPTPLRWSEVPITFSRADQWTSFSEPGRFPLVLKEKCPWHLDGNHTTEQCYQLMQALKDTLEPRHPHDKKGKKKNDKGNGDFQEPDKTVNVLFGGLPSRQEQKTTRREVMSIEPAVPTPLRWSEVPIIFSRADQWTSFSEPGRFPLVLKPVVAGSKLKRSSSTVGAGLTSFSPRP